MAVFELIPIALDNPRWAASQVTERAIVRAADEDAARKLAQSSFARAAGKEHGFASDPVLHPPWMDGDLVECRPLDGPEYDPDGPPAVLLPEGY